MDFFFPKEYSNWETDEVITRELIRNLCIALACVFLTTLILLADILGSVYVLVTVALSLVDLCGFMAAWDITIDVVSACNIIIAIGLCVDYRQGQIFFNKQIFSRPNFSQLPKMTQSFHH